MIELSGIVKKFGDTIVLQGIDLSIPEGSVTVLIGPSGGGKSTLLRCVNLLEIPDSGSLKLGDTGIGFDASMRPRRDEVLRLRRRTGMVFQSFNLFPHRSALRNVSEGLTAVLKWDEERAEARAMELLEKVGLAHKAKSYPHELSGGQQQRVAIARAMAHSPAVLLCDEPTSALDPELAAEVVTVLKKLADEGVTMILATHDLRLAAAVAHEVVFIENGRILESGTPQEVLFRPRSERAAAFVATLGHQPVLAVVR
ncbi:MAG: amino acid ABC transporter ATP-binding protein [Rectinemataceae bacterium]